MATIQTVTTKDAQLEIFGSLTVAELTTDWWASHKGAIVFPTDENKVYFGGVAYDGINFEDLKTLLSENYGLQLAISNVINLEKTSGYYTVAEVQALLRTVQTELEPGTGIDITDNTISAKPSEIVTADVVNPIIEANETVTSIKETADSASAKATTNATNITSLTSKVNQVIADVEAVGEALGDKQDKLTAGDGISISADNVISSTLDLTLYKIVTTLPSSNPDPTKIYLVKSTESTTNDIYEEYIWTGTAFEKLGEYKSEVDLTPYLKKTELATVLEGVTAADNNGTEVTIGQGTSADKTQIKAAIIIQ